MSIAQQFVGHDFAVVVGIGVPASIGGVMLVEYLALSQLVHAVASWSLRPIVAGIGIALVGFAPLTLIDPIRIYDDLLKP